MIGGCGSLYVPGLGGGHITAVDYPEFWRAFSNLMADSQAMLHYMEEALGHMGTELRKLGEARARRADSRRSDFQRQRVARVICGAERLEADNRFRGGNSCRHSGISGPGAIPVE